MLVFKQTDLDAEHESLSAYTTVPTHPLNSVTMSTMCFLDHNMNQPAQLTQHFSTYHDHTVNYDAVQGGLWFELDSYLHEPQLVPFNTIQSP